MPGVFSLSLLTAFCPTLAAVLLALPLAAPAAAQVTGAPAGTRAQATAAVSDSLQQLSGTMDQLQRTLAALSITRWKAPGDVRQTTQSDVESMQRDLGTTLPPLLTQSRANPAQLAPAFSVYRNVDALYDVLLRVSETAQLAGAANDGRALEEQRSALEATRTQLGKALLQSAQTQDAEVTQLRTAVATPATAPSAAKTVIDDGPSAKPKSSGKRTRKPAATPPPQ
jgi:hypothetical protein